MARFLVYGLFFTAFLSIAAFGQSTAEEDVIYLKNGSVLRGEIIAIDQGEAIKIRIVGGSEFVFDREEIDEIAREERRKPVYYTQSGYINHTGLDLLPGGDRTSVRLQMINGYQFTPLIAAGIGIGFTTYNDPLGLIPLYLQGKLKLKEANTAPFLFLRSGYTFSVRADEDVDLERHRGGWMLNPGLGLQFDTAGDFGLIFTAGYNIDHSRYEQPRWGGGTVENEITWRRVQLGFGLSF
ncbi:MAG: hypothetical protein ACOC4S_00370 [Balneolaceae bacterium]